MKVDQVLLEQLDTALNGKDSSGSGQGNGEFAAALDKALTGGAKENSTKSGMPKNGESVASSEGKEEQSLADQKVPENEKSNIEGAELEEKLELIMMALLKSDQGTLEKLTTKPDQQKGQLLEGKDDAFKGDKISTDVLKEELAAKIEHKLKQEGGLKVKDEALEKKAEAEAKEMKGNLKGEVDLKAKKASVETEALLKEGAVKAKAQNADKTSEVLKSADSKKASAETEALLKEKAVKAKAQNADKTSEVLKSADSKKASAETEAMLKEKAVKAQNADKTAEVGKNADKAAASKKGSPGETAEKQVDLKGKASKLETSRSENAEKKPDQAVKGNKEEAKNARVSAEQGSEKSTEQKAARANNVRQDTGLNSSRSESSRPDANMARAQNTSAFAEQNLAQQSTIKGDEALQGSRMLNAQNANLRESVMQQLQGKMTYLRESGSNPAEMRLTLHPPELGEVTVRVFSSKGRLSASIIAETPLAREILESSVTELRQRMNFVNIQFDQLDVSTAGKEHEEFDRPGDREGSGKAEFGEYEGDEKSSAESEPPPQQIPPGNAGSGIDFWA